jgi:hypothetical protein
MLRKVLAMRAQYFYSTVRGVAVLHVDSRPIKHLGIFKTEHEARSACQAHYAKATAGCKRLGVAVPELHFI